MVFFSEFAKNVRVISTSISRPYSNLFTSTRRFNSNSDVLLVQEINDKGIVVLNRPKVLNSLNKSLIMAFYNALNKMENKTLLLIKSSNEKAYCAGGDLITIINDAKKQGEEGKLILMYMNASITSMSSKKLPIIAFINGITFGGGVGLSVFGKYQVATEKTILAMPESKIGFHPNAGASYFFNRLNGHLGWYLGITGQSLKGSDVVRAGLASHYCHSSKLQDLEEELLNCSDGRQVANTLDTFCDSDLPEFSLAPVMDKIDRCFSAPSVEEIFTRLSDDNSDWAKETIGILSKLSPTSLKVIHRQLEKGKDMTLRECLIMEFNLGRNFSRFHEMFEGVRATLIDRDQNPRWNPQTLSEVSEELVKLHFVPDPMEPEQRRLLEQL